MAEQIISPGVFTRENDLSFLPQGVGAIGAAIVGPTIKGPAFIPTVVRSFAEYERRFGGLSSETFVPQTVREYLRNAGSVTVCRVLAGGGYTFTDGTNEPIGVVATQTSIPASLATSSIKLNTHPGAYANTNGKVDFVIVDRTRFYFIGDTANLNNIDQTVGGTEIDGQVWVDAGTTTLTAMGALKNAINASSLAGALGGAITASSEGTDTVIITGASSGSAGNVVVRSGSNASAYTSNLFEIPIESFDGSNGGQDGSSGDSLLLGLIYPSKALGTPNLGSSDFGDFESTGPAVSQSFTLRLQGSGISTTNSVTDIKANMNPTSNNYLFKKLGDSPNNSKTAVDAYNGTPGYTYLNFKNIQSKLQGDSNLSSSGYTNYGNVNSITLAKLEDGKVVTYNGIGQKEGYSYASTPFITSQINLGEKQLFRFHSLGHGDECNLDYKISIANLREPADIDGEEQYSTFSVLIRRYNDTDKNPIILEQYNNCNLNPDSPNYIARVIGDRYPQYNEALSKVELLGNYPNVSQLCRVEVSDVVASKAISPKLSPKGFKAISNPFASSNFSGSVFIPSASYEGDQVIGLNYNSRAFLGWKFDEKDLDNKNFLKPVDSVNESNSSGDFNVENYNGHPSSSLWVGSLSASIDTTGESGPTPDQLKFSVCFQGGFDGIAPYKVKFVGNESRLAGEYTTGENLYGFDMRNNASGSEGYKKALNILSNQDEYDINMLALPGVIKSIPGHSVVTNAAVDMVEERGDAFYVMDLTIYTNSVNQAVNAVSGLDTNYAAVYYPWVKVSGPSGVPTLVPPSVIVPGAIAASDRIAAEWFAPAGLNRGVLGNVIEAKIRLNQAERDRLYNDKINPIATFPQTGVCIWGQKTLQERSTALDRINVRRLLIALKKFIASSSRYLVFEQNTNATRNRFLNIVNPYLESVQQRQGLYSFRVQMDEANNTADVVDRNQLVGAIYLQPTKTAEFIILDFNVLPTGATFDGNGGGGY